jgi:phosphate starvation-inducible PhoH-like protein
VPKFKFLFHLIEKHIVLEDIDPVVFYGVGNGHLQMVRSLFPKLRIMARDNVVRVLGDEEQMAAFEEATEKLRTHVMQFNSLKEEDILDIVKGRRMTDKLPDDVVVYSMSGRPIKARTQNQRKLIEAYAKNDMVFAVGPAGTGKTYLSIALAVKALKEKQAKKIEMISQGRLQKYFKENTLMDQIYVGNDDKLPVKEFLAKAHATCLDFKRITLNQD